MILWYYGILHQSPHEFKIHYLLPNHPLDGTGAAAWALG